VKLAAIVLNYRTAQLSLGAVDSLRAGERKPDDVFLVDNGSADGSAEALRGAEDVTVIANTDNLGFSGGMNVGMRAALARGADLLLLVNSDARVLPDCVGALERALETDPALGIVGPVVEHADHPGEVESAGIAWSPRTGRMTNATRARGGVTRVDGVAGAVMLLRRAVLERAGFFADEFFFSFEDLDLCLRARAHGFATACVGEATALHEGSHSIGLRSPRRLYFAARNHLLLAQRTSPLAALPSLARGGSIAALNLAHAVFTSPAPLVPGLRAVARGLRDHLARRYGDDGPER
jgi:GT2 family glycosyltransferase